MSDELERLKADLTIEEFCDRHRACDEGRRWAIENCASMVDAWEKLPPDWLIWVASCPGVLTPKELRLFAVRCARSVEHLMEDSRSKKAIEVAERHAKGEATDEEIDAARAAARDAAWAALWAAAGDAARDEFAEYLRSNTTPSFKRGANEWATKSNG